MAAMGMKIAAGLVLALIGVALVFCGVGFLAYALVSALTPALGVSGSAAVAGLLFAGLPLLWAIVVLARRRRVKPKPAFAANGLWLTLFTAIAKETPWAVIAGAGLVAAVEMFLARRKK